MLNRKHKLKKDNDFKAVFSGGRFGQLGCVRIKFLKNELGINRFAFLVGIKISKKAVVRNKIKRKLEEAVRGLIDQMKQGFDVVVMPQPEIAGKEFGEIKENLSALFKINRLL